MRNIGEMVRRMVDEREVRELVNEEPPCDCGVCGGTEELREPRHLRNG